MFIADKHNDTIINWNSVWIKLFWNANYDKSSWVITMKVVA